MFGIADQPGMTVGCVNPAQPGATEWVPLDSYWYSRSSLPVPGGPIAWSSEGPPPSPYLRTEGLISGKCVNDGQRGYLSIRTNHKPGEKWTDRIGGEVGVMDMFLPGWGMHLSDMYEAQGDLVHEVGRDQRSIQNSCSTLSPSACDSLIASVVDGREHAVFDCVHGLARDSDALGELSLRKAKLAATFLQLVGEAFSHRGAHGVQARRS